MEYTFIEYADMHLMYGLASCNALEARRLYRERFPNRTLQARRHFNGLTNVQGRMFGKKSTDASLRRTVYTPQLVENILNDVHDSPSTSTRRLSTQLNASKTIVHTVLKEQLLYPYHLQKVHELLPEDFPRRMQFTNWLLDQQRNNVNFINNIVFTDEVLLKMKTSHTILSIYEVCKLSNETGNVVSDLATLRRQNLEGREASKDMKINLSTLPQQVGIYSEGIKSGHIKVIGYVISSHTTYPRTFIPWKTFTTVTSIWLVNHCFCCIINWSMKLPGKQQGQTNRCVLPGLYCHRGLSKPTKAQRDQAPAMPKKRSKYREMCHFERQSEKVTKKYEQRANCETGEDCVSSIFSHRSELVVQFVGVRLRGQRNFHVRRWIGSHKFCPGVYRQF
ncbi:hypothetical protein NQ318_022122 [Aromia moschata]|uniref:DUF4817 domain-containing protein n=1 Tax=Aromia moschata TaxID=1265417 RepID=A0AAV8Z5D9_9CUCU|nr:hypothetical protein NQ318_022122 [Aromia moschata]